MGSMKRTNLPVPRVPELAAQRAEALRLTKQISAQIVDIARAFWDVGRALEDVRRHKLYAALGYDTFRAYVDAELSVAATQAYAMIRVVQTFTREDAAKVESLDRAVALITYGRAVDKEPGELVRTEALVAGKPAHTAPIRDILNASRAQRDQVAKKKARNPAALARRRADDRLAAKLRAFHREHALGRAVITVSAGEVVVRFSRDAIARRLRDR